MKFVNQLLTACFLSMPLLLGGTVNAQEGTSPAATFNFSTKSVQVIAGITWGEGTLHFADQVYSFKVTGLNAVGVGVSSALIQGEVPELQNAEDFAGTYKGGSAGGTIIAGGTYVSLKNDKGVTIKLSTQSKGLQLNVGGTGLKVKDLTLVQPQ